MDEGQRGATGHHQAAGCPSLVEDGRSRPGRYVRQVRGQAHRVREGLGRHRRPVQGPAGGDRYPDLGVRAGELNELFSQVAKRDGPAMPAAGGVSSGGKLALAQRSSALGRPRG
jgi:hypothetical protein